MGEGNCYPFYEWPEDSIQKESWELFVGVDYMLRAICGGGLYDRWLSTFGSDDIPACGFGFGDAVIVEQLKEKGLLPKLSHQVENIVC